MSSRDGSLTFLWGDREHRFCLPIGQLIELEEKCNAGAPEIFQRLIEKKWKVTDLREILRLGLVGGGGVSPVDANVLLKRYFDDPARPLIQHVEPAVNILFTALMGPVDEPMGKGEPAGENATTTTTEKPDGGSSTEPAPRSASIRARSTAGRSGNTSPLSRAGNGRTA